MLSWEAPEQQFRQCDWVLASDYVYHHARNRTILVRVLVLSRVSICARVLGQQSYVVRGLQLASFLQSPWLDFDSISMRYMLEIKSNYQSWKRRPIREQGSQTGRVEFAQTIGVDCPHKMG